MFVSENGKEIILSKRREDFFKEYIVPLKTEAKKLLIPESQIINMIKEGGENNGN